MLDDNRAERAFVLPGDWRALERITSSENVYEVEGDPAQVNSGDRVTVTLPPLSLVNMVLE